MRNLLVAALVAAILAPAALADRPGASSATALCREQRRSMGMDAFRALYAPGKSPKAAMDACLARQTAMISTEAKNAAKACQAERESMGEQAFAARYGSNANKRNAFGKCVSQKTQEEVAEAQQATVNAARQCREERGATAASREAFAARYGTNANKRNAFGKCVSQKARELDDD